MKKVYCLIVLSLLANASASFAMDKEEKDQEYPTRQQLHPVLPLSYSKSLRYDGTWKLKGDVALDVSPIVAPPSTPIYVYFKATPLTTDKIIGMLTPFLKKGRPTLATKLRQFITLLGPDDMEYDEEFEKEKYTLLKQLAKGLNEQETALRQEKYLDFIMALSDGLLKSGLTPEEYFSTVVVDTLTCHLRK